MCSALCPSTAFGGGGGDIISTPKVLEKGRPHPFISTLHCPGKLKLKMPHDGASRTGGDAEGQVGATAVALQLPFGALHFAEGAQDSLLVWILPPACQANSQTLDA